MSNLEKHAELELSFIKDDGYDGMIKEAVMGLVKLFAEQGHSGFSAPIVVGLFEKLALFKPISPLTGADDEWTEVSDGVFQNKRASHVFKQKDRFDGQAYDINAVVFQDADGSRWTNSDSFRTITFPYTPTTTIQHRT